MLTAVSCVMPTRGRRGWVELAVRCWQEQTLPTFARELIVVDDGPEPCGDLVGGVGRDGADGTSWTGMDGRLRYVYLQGRWSIGAKFNLGCAMARGDLLAAWADDDYHAPWRLAHQVEAMVAAPEIGVCGCDSVLYWAPAWDELWRYENVPGRRGNAYVVGGTMMWRRAFWQARPFDESLEPGEDTRWIMGRGGLLGTLDIGMYVATIHGRNTSAKPRQALEASEQWQRMAGHVLDVAPAWWVAGALAAIGPALSGMETI